REVELRAQIERLSTLLERSQESIGFSINHFRSALSCALEIMGAEPLKASPNGHGPARCEFPALDQRPGADPSWAEEGKTEMKHLNQEQMSTFAARITRTVCRPIDDPAASPPISSFRIM